MTTSTTAKRSAAQYPDLWPSADVLVARATALVGRGNADADRTGLLLEPPHRFAAVEAAALRLHDAYHAVIPPTLTAQRAPRARAGVFLKKLVRRSTAWYVEPRWAVQRELNADSARYATAAILAMYRLHDDLVQAERRIDQLTSAQARLTRTVSDLAARSEAAERRLGRLEREATTRGAQADGLGARVDSLAGQLPALFERVGVSSAGDLDFNYVEFENRFRGDRSSTRDSLVDYVDQFPSAAESGVIVDIGCGRGEMVEILIAGGHDAIGVDSDADMVRECRDNGLDAVEMNGLTWLESQPPNSLKGIFCSQVVEHFVTPELERFVASSYKALRSGGIMIVETINPRSLFALANHFFADLSHVRPIHPETLRFMCEQVGFRQTLLEERSPHESMAQLDDLADRGSESHAVRELLQTVFGFQDYALKVIK